MTYSHSLIDSKQEGKSVRLAVFGCGTIGGGGNTFPRKSRAEVVLVVRFRHLHPLAAPIRANVGIKRTTSKLLNLVELLNLTFEQEPRRNRDSNVKFAPLMVRFRHLHPLAAPIRANVGVKRTTSKLLNLVELLNLTFEQEPCRNRDSNVKFAPQIANERTGLPQLAVRFAVPRAAEQSVHPRFDLGSKAVARENRDGVLAAMEPG